MEIKAIKLIENSDLNFYVSFMYGDHNLQTSELPRSTTKEEVLNEIKRVVDDWEQKRADENFQELKELENEVIKV
jgi:hypothetical protein